MSDDIKIINIDNYEFPGTPSTLELLAALTGLEPTKIIEHQKPILDAIKTAFEESALDEEIDRIGQMSMYAIDFEIMVDGIESLMIESFEKFKSPKTANNNYSPKI